MKLAIEWRKPIPLKSGKNKGLIYDIDLDLIPSEPGIYIFARKWGKSYEALYIGKSGKLKVRMKRHLNNLRLMNHIENAKSGRRYLIYGTPIPKPGQQKTKVLTLLEKTFIRHFMSEGHDLVNQQGVRIRRHEIENSGSLQKAFMPGLMYLERSRNE
ncbi:MAG: hypothetical protein CMP91_11590 [Gammaproteobacteria bacterium]|nr:hypothetical protein [Gammaproteobacteria bacterium]|tara:strand:+ start:365 stop:835 length:471 start_codon:yes stop_codon:yes gene_type:complete